MSSACRTAVLLFALSHCWGAIQGCPIICSNGGTPLPSCAGCSCPQDWYGDRCAYTCGGHVSPLAGLGMLTSPGFPDQYANDERCNWTVSVPTNSTVILSFKAMNLEECCDFVYVYKGTTTNSTLLQKYSGNTIPEDLILDSPFLVVFSTNEIVTDTGFSLHFQTYAGLFPKFTNAEVDAHDDMIVLKGESVKFVCHVMALPNPVIEWRKDGRRFVENVSTIQGVSELSINDVNESHAGWYICEAGNYLGSIRRSYQLIVEVPPLITHSPVSIYFERFESDILYAVFRCDVYGIPTPQITWKKDGSPLRLTRDNYHYQFVRGTRWLRIVEVLWSDFGNYSCYANSTAGEVESKPATLAGLNSTRLDPRFYFDIISLDSSDSVNVNKRASVILSCFPFCFHRLDFAVYKDGNFLNTAAARRISVYDDPFGWKFYLSFTTLNDTGIYEIKYVSLGLSWFAAINVQVPPTVVMPIARTISRKFREKVTIPCESIPGKPTPVISWYSNDLPINNTWIGHKVHQGYGESYLTLTKNAFQLGTEKITCMAGNSRASVNITMQAVEGWVTINEGYQCSLSCTSGDYGIRIIQRTCVIPLSMSERCKGPNTYPQACQAVRTTCSTDDYITKINVESRELPDTNQELSRGAVAGISVTVTGIVAVVICILLLYVIQTRLIRKFASGTGTTDMQSSTNEAVETQQRSRSSFGLYGGATNRQYFEREVEDASIHVTTGDRMNENPAYADIEMGELESPYSNPSEEPVYAEAIQTVV